MAKALRRPDELYERDFHSWLLEQAAHARAGRVEALDLENIAEELEGLARADRREIENRMEVLVTHLVKLRFIGSERPRRGWILTVNEQRRRIKRIIRDSPSLAPYPGQVLGEAYASAVNDLQQESDLPSETLPAQCPFTVEQALEQRFIPSPKE